MHTIYKSMEKIKVSVVIPCYNAERYVECSIRSIMQQTYDNIEIICIDDGSVDSTQDILLSLAKEDSRIKLYNNETNVGLVGTLNKGVELASGEFIARMDSDDISSKERIEKQLLYLLNNELDVCGTYVDFLGSNGEFLGYGKCYVSSVVGIKLVSLFDSPIVHPSMLAKSNVIKENQYSSEINAYVVEDYDLWCRLIRKGYRIGVLPEVLLHYRLNPAGESYSKHNIQETNHLMISRIQQIYFLNFDLSHEVVSLISGKSINKKRLTYLRFKECISYIEKIGNQFLSNDSLTAYEKNDIIIWKSYKKIYVSFIFLRDAKYFLKIISLFFLFKNFMFFLNKKIFKLFYLFIFYRK